MNDRQQKVRLRQQVAGKNFLVCSYRFNSVVDSDVVEEHVSQQVCSMYHWCFCSHA